jgi:hypothetical protein
LAVKAARLHTLRPTRTVRLDAVSAITATPTSNAIGVNPLRFYLVAGFPFFQGPVFVLAGLSAAVN